MSHTVQESEEGLEIDQRSNQEQDCSGGATCTSETASEIHHDGSDGPTKISQNSNQRNSCSNGATCSSSSTSIVRVG
jgi:hypothetical protein